MLTPLDLHNKVFKKSLRGYNQEEVDDFLDEVIKDYEALYKENLNLKENLVKERENITFYKDMEDTLQKTMVLAQKMSEDAMTVAKNEANLIIAEAQKRAAQIIDNAHQQVLKFTRRQENLRSYEKLIILKLKNFLKTQLEVVENGGLNDVPDEMRRENTK